MVTARRWLALLGVVAVVGVGVTLWQRQRAQPTGWLRYLPLADGTSARFVVTEPGGATGSQATNLRLWRPDEAGRLLDVATLKSLRAIPQAGPTDPRPVGATVATIRQSASGQVERGTAQIVALAAYPALIALDGQRVEPPIPLLPPILRIGEAAHVEGRIGTSIAYSATVTLQAREALVLPVGRLDECLRVAVSRDIGTFRRRVTQWYCAGVGLAREEMRDSGQGEPTSYALSALHSASRLLNAGEPSLPTNPSLESRVPDARDALASPLGALWLADPTDGVATAVPPLIAGDLLLVVTAEGQLIALDRATRSEQWRFQSSGPLVGAPALAAGRVVIGSGDGSVSALDAATGTFLWAVHAGPMADGPTATDSHIALGTLDGTLVVLDPTTGAERWRATPGAAIRHRLTLAGELLIVGTDAGVVAARDAATGAPRWQRQLSVPIATATLVDGGSAYVATTSELHRLAPDGGTQWSIPLDAPPTSDLALSSRHLLVAPGEHSLLALDRATGEVAWRNAGNDALVGVPLVVGNRIAVVRASALLILRDQDGQEAERVALDGLIAPTASPATDGRQLYLPGATGRLAAFGDARALPWKLIPTWQWPLGQGDALSAPPAFAEGSLYAASDLGQLFRLSVESGASERVGGIGEPPAAFAPAVAERHIATLSRDGALIALDRATGREAWRTTLDGTGRSGVLAAGDRFLTTYRRDAETVAVAYAAADGKLLWERRYPNQGALDSVGVLHGDQFFVLGDRVHAIDVQSGERQWDSTMQPDQGENPADSQIFSDIPGDLWPTQLAVQGAEVSVVALRGLDEWVVVTLDAATGQPVGPPIPLALPTLPAFRAMPARDATRLVVMANDGTLIGVDLARGMEQWHVEAMGDPAGPLLLLDGRVVYQQADGRLVARSLADGSLSGDFALLTAPSRHEGSYAPVVADGVLYAAVPGGIVALRLK